LITRYSRFVYHTCAACVTLNKIYHFAFNYDIKRFSLTKFVAKANSLTVMKVYSNVPRGMRWSENSNHVSPQLNRQM